MLTLGRQGGPLEHHHGVIEGPGRRCGQPFFSARTLSSRSRPISSHCFSVMPLRAKSRCTGAKSSSKPVLCHAYKLGLTEGQGVVGAKRGGKCMGTYIDDERQSSRPPDPRPAGLAANAPSARSQQLKGSMDPVFAAASCIWSLCGQSILICRRGRALSPWTACRTILEV